MTYTNILHGQYCVTLRYDLVAIYLEACETAIHICPLCVYDLYRLPIQFVWRYS